MKTTAGICSIRVRYRASRLGASVSCRETPAAELETGRVKEDLRQAHQDLLRVCRAEAIQDGFWTLIAHRFYR